MELKDRAIAWDQFLRQIRSFFYTKDFCEVPTPYLVASPGIETYIDPLVTKVGGVDMYLPTSPEFHLKKALAAGMQSIFEIKSVFRQDLNSKTHRAEFTMLEFYRVDADLNIILQDVVDIISRLKNNKTSYTKVSVETLFTDHLSFQLKPETSKQDLIDLCDTQGVSTQANDSWNDVFHRLWLERIEPKLVSLGLVFITDYPPQLAALAEIDKTGWAKRMEVFWHGLELGNAYYELRDKEEQRRRFTQINLERESLGKAKIPMDEEFISCLEFLPRCSGIAIGLERLFMAVFDINDIAQVKIFSN